MSDFSALNAAVTGLHAHRQRINTISENIANVDTPGYHRQVTNLSPLDTRHPGLVSGPGGQHGGVEATISRRWDQLLDSNAKQERSKAASLETQASALAQLETEIGTFSNGGLGDRLQQLWDGFDDLANNPGDLSIRNVALGNADAVASALNHEATVIDETRAASISKAEAMINEVNELARSIAEMDRSIVVGVAAGRPANGLIDQRDRAASELASLVNLNVSYEQDGQIRLSLDGHNLVADGQSRGLQLVETADAALTPMGYNRLTVTSDSGRELRLTGGSLHGSVTVANILIPEQRTKLDNVAASIVTAVNTLHIAGTGIDGSTGFALFDPAGTSAASFAVSADLQGRPERLAASDGSGVLDNSIARALAKLGTDPGGPSAQHADLLTSLGNRVRTLSTRADTASLAAGHADVANQSAVGVSLDEELADLVSAQRAYEASARMITSIDEMLDVLINRTGLVGR